MAEGNGRLIEDRKQLVHDILFVILLDDLVDNDEKVYPFEHTFNCPTMPTSWEIELKFTRVPEANGSYKCSTKLNRKDASEKSVKVSLSVIFNESDNEPPLSGFELDKEKMLKTDLLEETKQNIAQSIIEKLYNVCVTLEVKKCHDENLIKPC